MRGLLPETRGRKLVCGPPYTLRDPLQGLSGAPPWCSSPQASPCPTPPALHLLIVVNTFHKQTSTSVGVREQDRSWTRGGRMGKKTEGACGGG